MQQGSGIRRAKEKGQRAKGKGKRAKAKERGQGSGNCGQEPYLQSRKMEGLRLSEGGRFR